MINRIKEIVMGLCALLVGIGTCLSLFAPTAEDFALCTFMLFTGSISFLLIAKSN